MKQLTSEQAIAFADSKAWEKMSFKERALFQFNQECLCMPFDIFHEAVEKTIGRSVWTHEFALNYDGIKAELGGVGKAPTFEEILNMIPENKRIVIVADENQNHS